MRVSQSEMSRWSTATVAENRCVRPVTTASKAFLTVRIVSFRALSFCEIIINLHIFRMLKDKHRRLLPSFFRSFCPGLGAAYNGQTLKALVYFAVFVGLFQMAILTGGLPIFVLGFIGMWLFAALDSFRTARLIRSGAMPDGAEDIIVQRFSGNPKLWGIVLTVLGASFFLNAFFNFRFWMRGVLPVLLIGFGVYLLRDYVFKSKGNEQKRTGYEGTPNSNAFSGALSEVKFRSEEFDPNNSFETQTQVRGWKNR